jgi:short-subunit dehydrogenase
MKAAIVTGASSGIGLQISRSLLKCGYKVYGFGRDFSKTGLMEEHFYPITCDLMNIPDLCEKVKDIASKEELSVLVNNAGVGYFGPHEELNPKKLQEMVVTNLEVPMLLSQLLLRNIKNNAGFIINISSVTANKSNTHGCAYGATKAGLSSFSHSLFDEVRKYGVKVVTIHPDMTKTDFYRNADFCEGDMKDTYITPEEVAKAIEFILQQRDGIVISDITIQPQKHQIQRKARKTE